MNAVSFTCPKIPRAVKSDRLQIPRAVNELLPLPPAQREVIRAHLRVWHLCESICLYSCSIIVFITVPGDHLLLAAKSRRRRLFTARSTSVNRGRVNDMPLAVLVGGIGHQVFMILCLQSDQHLIVNI